VPEGRIIAARWFGPLEGALARDLARPAGPRDGTTWVLVPGNLLALHLRRRAAAILGGVMGVEFLTLRGAAQRMALPALAAEGRRPLPDGAAELALQRLLGELPAASYFHAFKGFRNAGCAVLRAVELLENCLWEPGALRRAAHNERFRDPAAPARLAELAGLWEQYRDWKRESGLFTTDDLVRAAGSADGVPAERPDEVLIYGFYDFTPAQRALVGRLAAGARACAAYLLWDEDAEGPRAGFEYAAGTLRWLKDTLGARQIEFLDESPESRRGTDLERLIDGIFTEHPPAEDEEALRRVREATPDGSVRIVSCPGEEPEAVELARHVLRLAQASPGPLNVGVLMRGTEGSVELLDEAFGRMGAAWYGREGLSLAAAPTARVALALLEVAAGQARRADIIDFLALARLDWPEGLSPVALDRLSREAGIVKGAATWAPALRARAAGLAGEARYADTEQEERARMRDAALCQTAAGFIADFLGQMGISAAPSWRRAAAELHRLVERFSPEDDPDRDAVLDAVERLRDLDVTGARPTPDKLSWILGRMLTRSARRTKRFQHTGVTASGIMGARGVTFDTVIVPGLVEKGFPRHIGEQPLLTEPDREALNAAAAGLGCGELPLQRQRPDEERYLFRLALGSARRTAVLTYSRLDQDKGRPRIPSRFLGEVGSVMAGRSVRASLIEAAAPEGWYRRVPLNRGEWSEEELRLALDGREYDAAVFAGPGLRRTGYLAGVSEHFRRALDMENGRWRSAAFGPYDGKVRAPDLLDALQRDRGSTGRAVSPTRFETYARCPFEYFLTYALGIGEVEEPSEELLLTPLERGALVHKLLRSLYEESLKGRPLGRLADGEVDALASRAGELLAALGAAPAQQRPAVWAVEGGEMLDQVRALLLHERAEHAGAAPEEFEFEFEHAPAALGGELAFHGRIDRLDRLPDGGVQVVDYKTGRRAAFKKNSFAGGTQLQLPIYLLCAAEALGAQAGSALYLHVPGPGDVPEFSLDELAARRDDFRRILRLILDGIARGDYFPLPGADSRSSAHCGGYCPYVHVCGAARDKLNEMKSGDPDAGRLQDMRAIQ